MLSGNDLYRLARQAMSAKVIFHGLRALGLASIASLLVAAPAQAYGHFGGGVGVAHAGVGGFRGGYGHYGYGFRGYGYGFRGGYYGWGGCCGYGWWGWPGGLFLATLPLYYSTLWWDGVPYYYADDNYYIYNAQAGGYVSVAPPAGLAPGAAPVGAPGSVPMAPAGGPGSADLFVYPKNAQSADQQEHDRQECRSWAASQSGATSRADNLRAQTACLEARGYSVK
jgi:hypothetical protein